MKKIVAINGSPHGKNGTTIYYFKYGIKYFPDSEYKVHNVGAKIKKIERDLDYFNSIIKDIKEADVIYWIFPAYIFIMPSQFKRFIELIWEKGVQDTFKGKYATSIMTSIHFCDDFGLEYIQGISEDLGMNYFNPYSAHASDIDSIEERKRLALFFQYFSNVVERNLSLPRLSFPIKFESISYNSENVKEIPKTKSYKMLLITDATQKSNNLNQMIKAFIKLVPNQVELINLSDVKIESGCVGCGNCQFEIGKCQWAQKDEYEEKIRKKIRDADVLILAPIIKDRYFSAKWKQMEVRRFVDNHRPLWTNKQVVYLISGPLKSLPNLQQLLHMRKQVNEAEIAGIITDEYDSSEEITNLIKSVIVRLFWALEHNYRFPDTFIGVAGKKLFRDFVWDIQAFFPGDYNYYKEHDMFNFPKKKRLSNFILKRLIQSDKARNWLGKKMGKKYKEKRENLLHETIL